ncbi:MAG: SMC-Scp complex subunit ScpB [Candidatus Doudnabacteria bacterium CG10_big_fil_rev_8_21_14_0_10_42_18]|uniref:SMC-Scp complex subunit ScpB n=1 Tax=Candidatus Doudnabacteria bacterium CG10_big_fil_rev_8_21_14_0_10_42_18 TaxID=1974552 RepID=A0A2H0VE31_9BACT|nr:MAG: SMC-Scp complex subunit ScpB [Candidatus Doudnabacteria bacterium CG10_big_fil_rev_8_21_14_0_10_42_18]
MSQTTDASNGVKSQIESLLFIAHKPLKLKDFSNLLEQDQGLIKTALDELTTEKRTSGIVLLEGNEGYVLATNSENSTIVKKFFNAELREKLTEATVEVLGIIAYRQPISKAEIEAIRGVNSQYSLRTLLMRGLVEKIPSPSDHRSFLYQTTTEFLMHLGLASVNDLPSFEQLTSEVKLPETPGIDAGTDAELEVSPSSLPPAASSQNENIDVQ